MKRLVLVELVKVEKKVIVNAMLILVIKAALLVSEQNFLYFSSLLTCSPFIVTGTCRVNVTFGATPNVITLGALQPKYTWTTQGFTASPFINSGFYLHNQDCGYHINVPVGSLAW